MSQIELINRSDVCVDFYYRYQNEGNLRDTIPMTDYQLTPVNILIELFNLHNQKVPTELSSKIANIGISCLCESRRLIFLQDL